jgi:hypothetical protein
VSSGGHDVLMFTGRRNDGPGGRHWRKTDDASPPALTSSIEDFHVRRRRAARAIARGQPVADEDREAGLEWAKHRVISGSAGATLTLAWGVPAVLGASVSLLRQSGRYCWR